MEKHTAAPQHIMAMKLNNRASSLIGARRYEQAISTLVKALKLSESVVDNNLCDCKFCSLDECIRRTQQQQQQQQQQQKPSIRQRMVRQLSDTSLCSACEEPSAQQERPKKSLIPKDLLPTSVSSPSNDDIVNGAFVYQNPILISTETLRGGHSLGSTLSLIIIFNLALAHHLNALQHSASRTLLKKAVQLYELAYQLHLDEIEDSSVLFTLIMANNLGQVHNAVNNGKKYRLCLEHLLSTMMFLVDCDETDIPCMDGFLRNTSQLVLKDNVAAAA